MIKKLFYFLILFVLISCDTRLTTSEIEEDLGSSLIESISEYYDVSYSDFDLLSFDLHQILQKLSELDGNGIHEEVLDRIFSRFRRLGKDLRMLFLFL